MKRSTVIPSALPMLALGLALAFALPASLRGDGRDQGKEVFPTETVSTIDSLRKPTIISARSKNPERVTISIRAVDISRYPEVNLILDARDSTGNNYPSLQKTDMVIFQDGAPVLIEGLDKISANNSVPVDIAFIIDQTGSMQQEVNEVKNNVIEFTNRLASRGVDYRLALISFSDRIERYKDFTEDVKTFISWIDEIKVGGGGDDNENALEGLFEATSFKFRQSAQRIFILITDAMFHQKGERGDGKTEFNTKSMIDFMIRQNVKLFAITPPRIDEYLQMTEATRGKRFNIIENFSSILDEFSESLTNLYAVKYRLTDEVPPEKMNVEIRNTKDEPVIKEEITVLDVDKKFVLENILFDFNRATFDLAYTDDLNRILAMLKRYTTMHVEIRGHTDFIGSDEYNVALSDARARAVKKFLSDRGVAAERMTTRGMGKSQPVAPNDTELGRRLNRRTEIIITKK
ncbi:MAG TPA: OmpA family protein [Bacteroidota bacterium]|nr:OmpA family protein [Bacteroidota bacterium]